MSKKIVLVGLLLLLFLLFSSVVYAPIEAPELVQTIYEITPDFETQIEISQVSQIALPVDPASLFVELEVIEPSGGFKVQQPTQKFWVNIYVTPATYKSLGSTAIKLSSSDPAVASFTGVGQNGAIFTTAPTYSNGVFSVTMPAPCVGDKFDTVVPKKRHYLGRLQMEIKKTGNFKVNLASGSLAAGTKEVYACFDGQLIGEFANYKVLQNAPKMISSFAPCVPKTAAQCSATNCGAIEDGCGGTVQCTNACASGEVCVHPPVCIPPCYARVCVNAVEKVLPNQLVQEKGALIAVANALQGKDKDGNALIQCPGGFCTLAKLNVIVTAIQAWLASS